MGNQVKHIVNVALAAIGIAMGAAVWDIATPLTYERYCGTYRGSWMTITPPGSGPASYPVKSKNLRNVYFAGQRIMPPGGMPGAVVTGRTAAQYLCKDYNAVFIS